MSTLHHPTGGFPLDPQSEKHELQDVGAADLSPTLGSPVTWDDVDRMWAAEMERRERQAACPAGYRDARCEACGNALFVNPNETRCCARRAARRGRRWRWLLRKRRAMTRGHLRRGHPDYPQFAALAARLPDDQLSEAINVADVEPATFRLGNAGQREAFIGAFSAEVLRRLSGRVAAQVAA